MKRLNENSEKNSELITKIVTVIGMITIMFYMILSVRNLAQVLINFSLLSAHSAIASIIFNIVLYVFVIVTGFEGIRRSKNPYYLIIALVTILIIY